jgi:hypothetical protein
MLGPDPHGGVRKICEDGVDPEIENRGEFAVNALGGRLVISKRIDVDL